MSSEEDPRYSTHRDGGEIWEWVGRFSSSHYKKLAPSKWKVPDTSRKRVGASTKVEMQLDASELLPIYSNLKPTAFLIHVHETSWKWNYSIATDLLGILALPLS